MSFIKCVTEVVRKTITAGLWFTEVSSREQDTVALLELISLSFTHTQYCNINTLLSSLTGSRINWKSFNWCFSSRWVELISSTEVRHE